MKTESTQRQYALRQRAISLGWKEDQIIVIDHDQGQSGASTVDREGFQRLVSEVGMGKAGIVMGLEVSRLARNCADWHRLLEICALTHSLILDEDGLYDPAHFNDRLLLGLKGTMSEAELHVLRARMIGGIISKAKRGELRVPLPVGLVYGPDQRVVLDPDQQVQNSLRHLFATFTQTGSAWGTVQAFAREGIKFPRHGQAGAGDVQWQKLGLPIVLASLHNPRYAGAFCFGKTRSWTDGQGKWHCVKLPRDQWRFLKKDVHPGYITWEQFEENQARLLANQQAHGGGQRKTKGPPREGPALLQGMVICGHCGRMMTLRYHRRGGKLEPDYMCAKLAVEQAGAVCLHVPGHGVDKAISNLLVESITPLSLEVSLKVQEELQSRQRQSDELRRQHVQRAQYEADQSRHRFMRVDPNNRLVADTLEADWNEKLRLLAQAREECEKKSHSDELTDEQKAKVRALAENFPRLWKSPQTPDRERKRMARLLLEDVTLTRDTDIRVRVRFRGGATRELCLPKPKRAWESRQVRMEVVAEVDRLLENMDERAIADELNAREWRTSVGKPYDFTRILYIRYHYKLKSREERLRARGLLTAVEVGLLLETPPLYVDYWREQGILRGICYNAKHQYMYEPPDETMISTIKSRKKAASPLSLGKGAV